MFQGNTNWETIDSRNFLAMSFEVFIKSDKKVGVNVNSIGGQYPSTATTDNLGMAVVVRAKQSGTGVNLEFLTDLVWASTQDPQGVKPVGGTIPPNYARKINAADGTVVTGPGAFNENNTTSDTPEVMWVQSNYPYNESQGIGNDHFRTGAPSGKRMVTVKMSFSRKLTNY
jgi:hypothetical protein